MNICGHWHSSFLFPSLVPVYYYHLYFEAGPGVSTNARFLNHDSYPLRALLLQCVCWV